MPKVSNEYTEEDFRIYFEDLFNQVQSLCDDMKKASQEIIAAQDTDPGYGTLYFGAKEVIRLLNLAHRDSFAHRSPEVFGKPDAVALRVSKLRRRREKLAREAARPTEPN